MFYIIQRAKMTLKEDMPQLSYALSHTWHTILLGLDKLILKSMKLVSKLNPIKTLLSRRTPSGC